MSVKYGLLDTNVVVALSTLSPSQIPTYPLISAITLAELSVGPLVATASDERTRRQLALQTAESTLECLPFDAACARRFGAIASELKRSGKKSRSRGMDILIAATAVTHNLALFTANVGDFDDIPGLEVMPVVF